MPKPMLVYITEDGDEVFVEGVQRVTLDSCEVDASRCVMRAVSCTVEASACYVEPLVLGEIKSQPNAYRLAEGDDAKHVVAPK